MPPRLDHYMKPADRTSALAVLLRLIAEHLLPVPFSIDLTAGHVRLRLVETDETTHAQQEAAVMEWASIVADTGQVVRTDYGKNDIRDDACEPFAGYAVHGLLPGTSYRVKVWGTVPLDKP